MDGCFDMMHYGHSNALRKGKATGNYLIAGVHSDEEIKKHKGPPVTKEEERYKIVRSCKWVDEVVPNAPYTTELAILEKYHCDYCVHGDDIVTDANGVDTYAEVKNAGKFKCIPRTVGVSTTDLVGRMLLIVSTNDNHGNEEQGDSLFQEMAQGPRPLHDPLTTVKQILHDNSFKIVVDGKKPKDGDRIGYINGTFDVFHSGHADILEASRNQCDYLIVGLYSSDLVKEMKGREWPIMALKERALTVLACKFADEIIMNVPWTVSEEFLNDLKIDVVFTGSAVDPSYHIDMTKNDGFEIPRVLNKLITIESQDKIQATTILERIIANRTSYLERNKKKLQKESSGFS